LRAGAPESLERQQGEGRKAEEVRQQMPDELSPRRNEPALGIGKDSSNLDGPMGERNGINEAQNGREDSAQAQRLEPDRGDQTSEGQGLER